MHPICRLTSLNLSLFNRLTGLTTNTASCISLLGNHNTRRQGSKGLNPLSCSLLPRICALWQLPKFLLPNSFWAKQQVWTLLMVEQQQATTIYVWWCGQDRANFVQLSPTVTCGDPGSTNPADKYIRAEHHQLVRPAFLHLTFPW